MEKNQGISPEVLDYIRKVCDEQRQKAENIIKNREQDKVDEFYRRLNILAQLEYDKLVPKIVSNTNIEEE